MIWWIVAGFVCLGIFLFFRMIEKTESKIQAEKDHRASTATLNYTEEELIIENEATGKASIKWTEIKSILAYKQDLYFYDLICLRLTTKDAAEYVLNEEMKGFFDLFEAFEIHLGLSSGWYIGLTVERPFRCNPTIIYSRPAQN